MVTSWIS